jgi:hypothetical protein
VGLTRAKYSRFVLGDTDALLENGNWKQLIYDCKGEQCLYNVKFVELGGAGGSRWLTFHRGGTFQLCTEKRADPKDEEQEVKSEEY